jgi:hypothetical protein
MNPENLDEGVERLLSTLTAIQSKRLSDAKLILVPRRFLAFTFLYGQNAQLGI